MYALRAEYTQLCDLNRAGLTLSIVTLRFWEDFYYLFTFILQLPVISFKVTIVTFVLFPITKNKITYFQDYMLLRVQAASAKKCLIKKKKTYISRFRI